jgi:membrane associated rhomboid family serine protease
MTQPAVDPLEAILRFCAAALPQPWYPKLYAESAGVARDSLDPPLDKLRMNGLIRLTEWVQGRGQGYTLTEEGTRILQSPRELERLRTGKYVPPSAGPPPTQSGTSAWDQGEAVRASLLSPSRAVVTRALIAVNVVFFLYEVWMVTRLHGPVGQFLGSFLSGGNDKIEQALGASGALNATTFLQGEWWRLFTCFFVHIGLIHLGMNMLFLFRIGSFVEQIWGPVRYLVIYFLSGLGASCLGLATHPGGLAGASGALCGIFASQIAWLMLNRKFLPPRLVSAWTTNLVTNVVLLVMISLFPGVSWGGHLGGAIVGLVVGVLLHYQRFGGPVWRWGAVLAVMAVPVLCVGGLYRYIQTSPASWANAIQGFEIDRMNDHYLPAAHATLEEAMKKYEELAEPLRRQHPERRKSTAVQEALQALAEQRTKLLDTSQLLSKAGPFRSRRVEETRQVRQEILEQEAKLFEMTEQYLQNNEKNDEALDRQEEAIDKLIKRFHNLLNSKSATD